MTIFDISEEQKSLCPEKIQPKQKISKLSTLRITARAEFEALRNAAISRGMDDFTDADAQRVKQFVLSTDDVDRHQHKVEQDSWLLDDYVNNPLVLFNHDLDTVIGKGLMEEILDLGGMGAPGRKGLVTTILPTATGMSQEADLVWRLVEGNFIKGASPFFYPNRVEFVEKDEDEGTDYLLLKECNLMEQSVVSLPAGQYALKVDALQIAASLNPTESVIKKVLGEGCVDACMELVDRPARVSVLKNIVSKFRSEDMAKLIEGQDLEKVSGTLTEIRQAVSIMKDVEEDLSAYLDKSDDDGGDNNQLSEQGDAEVVVISADLSDAIDAFIAKDSDAENLYSAENDEIQKLFDEIDKE